MPQKSKYCHSHGRRSHGPRTAVAVVVGATVADTGAADAHLDLEIHDSGRTDARARAALIMVASRPEA